MCYTLQVIDEMSTWVTVLLRVSEPALAFTDELKSLREKIRLHYPTLSQRLIQNTMLHSLGSAP